MIRNSLLRLAALVLLLVAGQASAALNVFATVPEWAALAREIGGDKVSVFAATSALQDPHRIEARPSLIARARSAGLVIATGAELEIGWLPVVLRESGNAAIQPGQPGYLEAAQAVRMLEVPARLDRADGDVHPGGNPHIQLDPRNILKVADALVARLAQVDPANAAAYKTNHARFSEKWRGAMARWDKDAAPLRGVPVWVHHKAFPYLSDWLGLKEVAVLEPKPGVEPTAAHLQGVLATLKATPARMVIYAAYQDPRPSDWLNKNGNVPVVKLPFTVGGTDGAKDLFGLFDDTVARLLAAGTGGRSRACPGGPCSPCGPGGPSGPGSPNMPGAPSGPGSPSRPVSPWGPWVPCSPCGPRSPSCPRWASGCHLRSEPGSPAASARACHVAPRWVTTAPWR